MSAAISASSDVLLVASSSDAGDSSALTLGSEADDTSGDGPMGCADN